MLNIQKEHNKGPESYPHVSLMPTNHSGLELLFQPVFFRSYGKNSQPQIWLHLIALPGSVF